MKSILRTAAAIAAVASSAVAHAQYYCPPGSAYYASNYGSSCTLGTCWATSPFSGSQSAAPLGWPGWYYACATDGPPPPPPPAGRIYYFKYDNQSNVKSVDGPLTGTADTTTNTYDALNRLSRVTDPNAGQVNYGYDALDQLVSVSDPRSLVTSYSVNGLGNLNQQVSPDTGTTANTYDAAGNLLTSTDAKSQVTIYTYDALNRVASIAYQGGLTHTFQYDQGSYGKGRLTQITEPNSTTQYVYDQKGRLVSETRTINAVVYATGYSYDSAGRLSGMTYPSGRTVAYSLDSLGRIQSIATTQGGTQTVVSAVSYFPFGAVEGFSFGNGQTYARVYDQDERVASYTMGGAPITLGYDAASRITALGANSYGYDLLDRLTQAVLPASTYGYSYDATGNRLTRTAGGSTGTYAYPGTSNRLSSITPSRGPVLSYTHDTNGSVTADGVNTYTYDMRGRLIQSVSAIGTTTYQVNALGQRIRKTSSLGDTVYHYDQQGRLIAETSAAGAVVREYLYLGDLPVAVANAAGQLYYIHADHLGTPRLIANAIQQAVWRWDQQEPFSVSPPDENPSGLGVFDLPLRLPGQYLDKETNLHYNYFRDYDPSTGRYVESDPIGLDGGLNTYSYVGDDSIGFADPDGLGKQRAGTTASSVVTPLSNAYANSLINQIQLVNPQFRYPSILTASGQGGYTTRDVEFLYHALQQARTCIQCSVTPPVWPWDPYAMNSFLGLAGTQVPNSPRTPGRNKMIWTPSSNVRVTYEQHPYDALGPIFHCGPHWHLDTPGRPHQLFVPTQFMPGAWR